MSIDVDRDQAFLDVTSELSLLLVAKDV